MRHLDRQRSAGSAWKAGFAAIGQVLGARHLSTATTRARASTAARSASFRAYTAKYNLQPTAIDYAFFKDRAAHMSASLAPIQQAIANLLAAQPSAARWKVRQAIALNVRPRGTQRADRLGRDVAFYIDGAGVRARLRRATTLGGARAPARVGRGARPTPVRL